MFGFLLSAVLVGGLFHGPLWVIFLLCILSILSISNCGSVLRADGGKKQYNLWNLED